MLQDAVQTAIDLTDEDDTLIIVTSDHSHAFVIAGYPALNDDILGITFKATRWCLNANCAIPIFCLYPLWKAIMFGKEILFVSWPKLRPYFC